MRYSREAIKAAIDKAKSESPYDAVIEICRMLEAEVSRRRDNRKKPRGHRR